MWLITSRGFISVVGDRDDSERVLIRARSRGDLERIVGFAEEKEIPGIRIESIFEDSTADYRHRVFAPRDSFTALAAALADGIDYPNFKNEVGISDPGRAALYGEVWSVLHRIQNSGE